MVYEARFLIRCLQKSSNASLLVGFGLALALSSLMWTGGSQQKFAFEEPAVLMKSSKYLGDMWKDFDITKGDDASAIRLAAREGDTRAMETIALASSGEQRQATIDALVALVDRPWHDDLVDTSARHSVRMRAAAALGKVARQGDRVVIDVLTDMLMRRTLFMRHRRLPDACIALGKVAYGDQITINTLNINMRKPPMQRQACAAEALIWALPRGAVSSIPALRFLREHLMKNTLRLKGEGFSAFEFASAAVMR